MRSVKRSSTGTLRQTQRLGLAGLVLQSTLACSSDAQSLGSLIDMAKEPLSNASRQDPSSLRTSEFDIRLQELESNAVCPNGGIKVELWQKGERDTPVLFQEYQECTTDGESGWTKARKCDGADDTGCLVSGSDGQPKDNTGLPSQVDSIPLCQENLATDCIANENFLAVQNTNLSPENIKSGVTIAGLMGTLDADFAFCSSNGETGCLANASYRAADLSSLLPENIKAGQTIAGVVGVYPSSQAPLAGSEGQDLPSLAASVPAGLYQFFKSDGTRIMGSISDAGSITASASDQDFDSSLYRGFTVAGDADLHAGNILAGIAVFGVSGNVALPPTEKVESGTYFGPQGNSFVGEIEHCDTAGSLGCLTTNDFKPYSACTMNGQVNCAANSTFQAWQPVTASVSASASSADEGESINFNVATSNLADGTVLRYEVSGTNITSADLTSGTTNGQMTVTNNQSSLSITLKEDQLLEGDETLTLTLLQPIANESIDIADTSQSYLPDSSLPLAWYDASVTSSLVLSGDFVSQWRDLSPNGHHLNQSTPTHQPRYQSTGWGGGTQSYIDWGTTANPKHFSHSTGITGMKEVFIAADFDGESFPNFNGLLTGSSEILLIGSSGGTTWFSSNSFSSNFYLNGSSSSSTTFLPAGSNPFVIHARSSTSINLSTLVVGLDRTYTSLNRGWLGKIAEILIYDDVLSSDLRAKTEGYLAWKWGFQDRLDPSHPYRTNRP